MAENATEFRPVVQTPAISIRMARFPRVVERTAKLSDDVLKSLEASERVAIDAVGQFAITLEEELPHEIVNTSDVAKKITESSLEMADRLVHTQYEFLRHVVDSGAKSLSSHDGAKSKVA